MEHEIVSAVVGLAALLALAGCGSTNWYQNGYQIGDRNAGVAIDTAILNQACVYKSHGATAAEASQFLKGCVAGYLKAHNGQEPPTPYALGHANGEKGVAEGTPQSDICPANESSSGPPWAQVAAEQIAQGCQAVYAILNQAQKQEQQNSAPSDPMSQRPGYAPGYATGQQNYNTLASEDSPGSVPVSDMVSWCDENADPEYGYAPTNADGSTNTNPNADPAIVGCIAGMKKEAAK